MSGSAPPAVRAGSVTQGVSQAVHGMPWLHEASTFVRANMIIAAAVVMVLFVCASVWSFLKAKAERGVGGPVGGLNYVVGPQGAGKSMFGVRAIVDALMADRYVVTNVRLLPGWAERICERHYGRDYRDPERRARVVRWLEGRYIFERSLRKAMRYRIPCADCGGDVKECGHVGPQQEGRALMVWDETHNDLNNRDYQGHGIDREERERERELRRRMVRWGTQLRKLGYVGFLLSQHHENTDAQLRRVCNHIVRLQNQRNSEGSMLAQLLPRRMTYFLVWWYPAHLATGTAEHMIKPTRKDGYFLPWTRHLYDSWETFHGIDDDDDDVEYLPLLLPAKGWHPEERGEAPPPGGGERSDHTLHPHPHAHSTPEKRETPVSAGASLKSADERTPRRGHASG